MSPTSIQVLQARRFTTLGQLAFVVGQPGQVIPDTAWDAWRRTHAPGAPAADVILGARHAAPFHLLTMRPRLCRGNQKKKECVCGLGLGSFALSLPLGLGRCRICEFVFTAHPCANMSDLCRCDPVMFLRWPLNACAHILQNAVQAGGSGHLKILWGSLETPVPLSKGP